MSENELYCFKCGVPLEDTKTEFTYLGHGFHHELPRCPKCGQAHVSYDTASGKMLSLEMQLEEK